MEEQQRQFRGIWIPKEIWFEENLTIQEKIMMLEIDSLEDEVKGCYASNQHFAKLMQVQNQRVSKILQTLQEKGYITMTYIRENKEVVERQIRINKPPYPTNTGVSTKEEEPPKQMKKESNTYLSNTLEYKEVYNVDTADSIPYKQIIDLLNQRTGSAYKHTTPKTKQLIKARFNEGFTLEDFQIVIDKMTMEWINDTKMKQYLRPETLFGTKFESYLNKPYIKKENKYTVMEEFLRNE